METGTTIITLILTGVIALPFIFYYLYKKIKGKKFIRDFINLAERKNNNLAKELWKKYYAIGIDSDSKKLLYFNKRKDKEQGTVIDLSEVVQCRIVNTDLNAKGQNVNDSPTNRLELVFAFHNSDIPEKALEFYNNPAFMPAAEDFVLIEKWLSIINSNLKNGKN